MSKLTLQEKRLETLRRQLYGVGENKASKKVVVVNKLIKENTSSFALTEAKIGSANLTSTNQTVQDSLFLKKDLTRIAVLSTVALVTQILLYYGFLHNLIKLHF